MREWSLQKKEPGKTGACIFLSESGTGIWGWENQGLGTLLPSPTMWGPQSGNKINKKYCKPTPPIKLAHLLIGITLLCLKYMHAAAY